MEGLKNVMEDTVFEKIDQLWKTTDYCQCNQCRMDVATFALNRLPPRYVQSNAGVVLHRFDANTTQTDAEITATVYQAIKRIGENPSHDKDRN